MIPYDGLLPSAKNLDAVDRRRFSLNDVTMSDPRWQPHDFRSKRVAPTERDARWRPHEVRYRIAVPVTRSVTPRRVSQRPDHGKVASRPRARCHSSFLCTRGIYRSGSSPCIWRLANLGAYYAIVCCSPFCISMNSSLKLLSLALCSLYFTLLFA